MSNEEYTFKLFEFNVYNQQKEQEDDDNFNEKKDDCVFTIQAFGINETGRTCAIRVTGYAPYFYVKIGSDWGQKTKLEFLTHIKQKMGAYYADTILDCKIMNRKKLYGFDAEKEHKFVVLKFANIGAFNKAKNLWYQTIHLKDGTQERKLLRNGYRFRDYNLELYEANIPPILRFFHIREISPSGWIQLDRTKVVKVNDINKTTTCDYEFIINWKDIVPLNDKETIVPYKIMSFDIEASSSHGDFPVPVKSYKKLATEIVDTFEKNRASYTTAESQRSFLSRMIYTAFDFDFDFDLENKVSAIELVYPKKNVKTTEELDERIQKWFKTKSIEVSSSITDAEHIIENMFKRQNNEQVGEEEGEGEGDVEDTNDCSEEDLEDNKQQKQKKQESKIITTTKATTFDVICDKKMKREDKIHEIMRTLRANFPALEGDKVTFIGSTFVRYGQGSEPYLNHCIVLDTCDDLSGAEIESYRTERECLLAWSSLVQRENPDIIVGYNIFGFDYEFMFRRAQELNCVEDFLKLSRNKEEICSSENYHKNAQIDIDRSSTTLASGTYDLAIIKMNGRLQIDMLNWFRRTENLSSYKLDYVAGHFIGDETKKFEYIEETNRTRVLTKNMMGLLIDSFIHFEEINHSSDYYKDGAKFRVVSVNRDECWFEVEGNENPIASKVKWGLAKDDVSPKDIFRMTNEGPSARSIIAKYCIQDCNLVQHLYGKVDVMTDLVEMAKLCSVPMSFLIFRGQGIKLTSYVAKKCREKEVLMPVISRGSKDDSYEGAIVLDPKCGLYLNEPVCVGDFASLYPSSMLSENLCPSSKVWTQTYDLEGNPIGEHKSSSTKYAYDNLPEYDYINIQFDTYTWVKKTLAGKAQKVKSGYKICRFAQKKEHANGTQEKAIMPSILQELLKARKDTRKMIPKQTDEFMKNVLDKRQLAYKVTANSLYGQLGAKTSTFYEPDIAAATTATGRLLLTYAKRVVEECYADTDVDTKYGRMNVKAEYIYGDTDSVFFKFNMRDLKTGQEVLGEKALELSIEVAQEATHLVSQFLKQPHDFEYEKTYMPFCLLSKKRYVAIKYETDITKGKRNEMGIVLKRRDNAPIVKDIYGGVIDILMKEKNIQKAVEFVNGMLKDLVKGRVPMEKLIITKSLRSNYKNPNGVAHKVLADRIAAREPGNKPSSGDRIPYVYIVKQEKRGEKMLQGDKIETPAYIKEHKLKIDYSFYITNQIMKPLLQLFGLVLNELWLSQKIPRQGKVTAFKQTIEDIQNRMNDETEESKRKIEKKINVLKEKEVQVILFDKYLREADNAKRGYQSIVEFIIGKPI